MPSPRPTRRPTPARAALAWLLGLAGCAAQDGYFRPSPSPAEAPAVAGGPRDEAITRAQAVAPAPPAESPAPTGPSASVPVPETAMAPSVPPPAATLPINLPSALKLAEAENPTIGQARARIAEALAQRQKADVLLLPNLNAGGNYHGHVGNQQRSAGNIINLSQQAFYFGGGAGAYAQGPPEVPAVLISTHLTDAIYEPLKARQRVDEARAVASATANDVLLEVADHYLELHGATARLAARRRTEGEAAEVVRITRSFAERGLGRPADADRAATEWRQRRAEVRVAEEQVAVAAARLARRLHLDPSTRVEPVGDPLALYALIDLGAETEALVQAAVRARPEVRAGNAGVAVAETRLRQELARPLLPTLWLGFSGGAFGGGSNRVPPLLGHFGGRTDFDAVAYWTLQNLGVGNLATQRTRRAEIGAAVAGRSRAITRVRQEVAAARGDALARREQIGLALAQLADADDGFRKDLQRIRGAIGRPIEVLDNLRLLRKSREDLIDAVVGYNQAQFRLFVALGSPPPLRGPTDPVAPPVARALLASNPPRPAVTEAPKPPAEVREDIARLAMLRGGDDATRRDLAELARAHQRTVDAMLGYDKAQSALLDAAVAATPADRVALRPALVALGESHRRMIAAQLDYDRILWRLVGAADAPTPPPAVEASKPAGELKR
ncbi:MAG TPA: TolC family protein [Isosphaeraceae bacterium]|jgi:outer membrane protein TolC|nr:TolC family protein [Isosphaeraceae bacterium]